MWLRFRYSLRIFLCCWLLIGLMLGWFGICLQRGRKQAAAIVALQENWHVSFDYDFQFEGIEILDDGHHVSRSKASPIPAFLIDWLGIDFFHSVEQIEISPTWDGDDPFADPSLPEKPFDRWEVLAALPALRELQFSGHGHAPVGDEFFERVSQLEHLEKLVINNRRLKQTQLALLHDLPELKSLEISNCLLDRMELSSLHELPKLESLRVSLAERYRITTSLGLPKCPQLRILELSEAHVDDLTLQVIADCSNLEMLFLNNTGSNSKLLECLQKLPKLTRLSLRYHHLYSDDELAQVVESLPRLEVIDLGDTEAGGKTLAALSELPALKAANLNRTPAASKTIVDEFCSKRPDVNLHIQTDGSVRFHWIEFHENANETFSAFD